MLTDNIIQSLNRSTGPLTPEGKAISAQNAATHGCSSRTIHLTTDESIADYNALKTLWFKGYNVNPNNPENPFEADLIHKCVEADWLARRAERKYAEHEANLHNTSPGTLESWAQLDWDKLRLANRYKVANQNALAKARKALEDYRKARNTEKLQQQKRKHNEEKHTANMARSKAKIDPEDLNFNEVIEEARQLSIRLGYLNPDGTPTGKK